jgi:hypothetical protein
MKENGRGINTYNIVGELFNQNPESAYLYEGTRSIGEIFANDSCAATPEVLNYKIRKSN